MVKFKIVIPSYNNAKWARYNIASILNQTYKNYEVLYIDDYSTDDTHQVVVELVGNLPNWKVVRNTENRRRGYNTNPHGPLLQSFMQDDEEVLMFIDGDDWLYDNDVLQNLANRYATEDYWMTYGRFVCYPHGNLGHPQNTEYPKEVHGQNLYRQDTWRASHLRTFKWHLFKRINEEDLKYTKTGEYYYHAEDLATSFPCLEMCPQEKIGVVKFITYVYNTSEEARSRVEQDASREPLGYQQEVYMRELEIRNRKPYNKIIP